MKIIFSPLCLEYKKEGHPESPERIKASYGFLKEKGYSFVEAKECSENDLLLVHAKEHIERVKKGNFFDADTPSLPKIYEYAKLAAGSAIKAAEISEKEFAFSLIRPPGHHAGKGFLCGFCYFNNIAIAVSKILKQKKAEKIAVLDIDAHHGNGTQDIFLGNEKVLYVSLHQSPLFPRTGLKSIDNCINYPLAPGTKEKEYLKTLKKALAEIKNFHADMLAISAGFDTFKQDTLANIMLEKESYKKIARLIKNIGMHCFAVLEGGYSRALGECIEKFLCGFRNIY